MKLGKKQQKYEVKEKLPVSLKLKESIELLCRERASKWKSVLRLKSAYEKQGFVWFVYEGCFVRRATTKYTIEWWWAARTSLVHKPCTFGVKVSVVICFFNREHLTEKYIKKKTKRHNKLQT